MRKLSVILVLAGVVLLVSRQTISDERANLPSESDRDGIELSDDQIRFFVENVGDFLYRFGGRLDQDNFDLVEELPASAAIWRDQAYARLKHEAVALCQRASQYNRLGLAAEINRIGREFTARFSKRVRLELSHLSDSAYAAVREYVWTSDMRVAPTPWEIILSMVSEQPNHPRGDLEKLLCTVAHERL
ncbi:MAG: hypothetical protein WD795_17650 [Woeseia sp.]